MPQQTKIEISKPIIEKEEINAVVKVLKARNLSQGPLVKEFEEKFAKLCGAKYAIAVNNGTASLHAILHALDIGPGDEVITTPFTFVATANSILMAGATPVFVDIEDETYNLDPEKVKAAITKKTAAIMPVSLFGHMYDVKRINALAKEYGLPIIEDAAQSVMGSYKNKMSGGVSVAGSFSLYATKNLTAGVGGVITTNSARLMKKVKLFRHHGQDENTVYEYIEFGYNYRMMDMIAAIGIEQIKKIDSFTKARRKNAERLSMGLKDIKGLILPVEKPGYKHVYHQYSLRVLDSFGMSRDEFIEKLHHKNIMAKIYYPKSLHRFNHLKKFGKAKGGYPITNRCSRQILSLPVHPLVTKKEIDYIIDAVHDIANNT